ncbi:hypothetical protein GCM10010252_15330 [Streptomyces aureoverticillatus]|nr:hypothetical protein GCM10010252_15330 [Streptomyces aureoverticillatus]
MPKADLAQSLGAPSGFGQSQFAFMRGHAFEARVKADGGAELLRLTHACLGGGPEPEPGSARVPDLTAAGPEGRAARTALALREATAAGAWTLLDHPMLALDVAGTPAFLEPDAVVVAPDGTWTVVEIKSFPMIDGAADAAKVGAAARQAAVYVLALEQVAARVAEQTDAPASARAAEVAAPASAQVAEQAAAPASTQVAEVAAQADEQAAAPASARASAQADEQPSEGPGPAPEVRRRALLVCPKDFSNLPAASPVDIRKQLAVTRRQLSRLARVEDIAATLPPGTTFDVTRPAAELTAAVDAVPATYAPECLAACELAFHCRDRARAAGELTSLGRSLRADLGALTTVEEALAAARGAAGDPDDPAVAALRRAGALRAEALGDARVSVPGESRAEAPAECRTEAADASRADALSGGVRCP